MPFHEVRMTSPNQRRKRVDIRHAPARFRNSLAVVIILIIGAAAWVVGRDQPVPGWIGGQLVPLLGIGFALLVVLAGVEAVVKWRASRQRKQTREKR